MVQSWKDYRIEWALPFYLTLSFFFFFLIRHRSVWFIWELFTGHEEFSNSRVDNRPGGPPPHQRQDPKSEQVLGHILHFWKYPKVQLDKALFIFKIQKEIEMRMMSDGDEFWMIKLLNADALNDIGLEQLIATSCGIWFHWELSRKCNAAFAKGTAPGHAQKRSKAPLFFETQEQVSTQLCRVFQFKFKNSAMPCKILNKSTSEQHDVFTP